MLHYDPNKRLTIDEAINHPWLSDVNTNELSTIIRNFSYDDDIFQTELDFTKKSSSIVASEIFLRFAAFNCSTRLQVEFLLMFVKLIDRNLLHENLEAFQMIDEDNSGEIDSQECVKKLTSINANPIFGVRIDVNDVDTFIKKVDVDNSGKISYS